VDSAVAQYDRLVSGPGGNSARGLAYDFRLGPFRHDPRFQALLRKYENRGAP